MYLHLCVSFALLFAVSRKNLWMALFISASVISFPSLGPSRIISLFISSVSELPVLLLAVSVGMISIVGGAMEKTGLMSDLVNHLKINIKLSLVSLPGMIGMLPIPGGAILSAPIVNKLAPGIKNDTKAIINILGRHGFELIYPLDIILLAAVMAGLNTYQTTLYMVPYFLLLLYLVYLFFLRNLRVGTKQNNRRNYNKLLPPLAVLLTPPFVHIALTNACNSMPSESFLFIGVLMSMILVCRFGKLGPVQIWEVAVKMKCWNYALIILAIFFFLDSFEASEFPGIIHFLDLSKPVFVVGIGALLGFITGRVNVPLSILIPLFISKYGKESLDYFVLSSMIFSSMMGYIISPVHPCVSVTLEYFNTSYGTFFRQTFVPILIATGIGFAYSYLCF